MSKYGLCIRYQIKDANILSADAEKILNFFKFPQKLAELNLQKIDDEKQILEIQNGLMNNPEIRAISQYQPFLEHGEQLKQLHRYLKHYQIEHSIPNYVYMDLNSFVLDKKGLKFKICGLLEFELSKPLNHLDIENIDYIAICYDRFKFSLIIKKKGKPKKEVSTPYEHFSRFSRFNNATKWTPYRK